MVKIISLIAFALFLGSATVCKPEFLATNTFLIGFVNQDVLALLSVILTVTLASVANIHLALNRIVAKQFNNNPKIKALAKEIKSELKDNCWYIFWGFVLAFVMIFAKGSLPVVSDKYVVSAINGSILWIVALYLLCMFDVYQVVFGIADMDNGTSGASDAPDISEDGGGSGV